MKHEFTDTQLRQAVADFLEGEAVDLGTCALGEFFWTQQVKALRKMLNALPEPTTDEWEQCRFEDIQKGDRVKRVMQNSDGTISTIEGPAVFHHLTGWGTNDHYLAFREDDSQDNIALYRIPAPVQHPDPAQHQFIRVDGKDYEAIPESGRYKLLGPGLVSVHVINRENITEWTELELVPKEVADGDR